MTLIQLVRMTTPFNLELDADIQEAGRESGKLVEAFRTKFPNKWHSYTIGVYFRDPLSATYTTLYEFDSCLDTLSIVVCFVLSRVASVIDGLRVSFSFIFVLTAAQSQILAATLFPPHLRHA